MKRNTLYFICLVGVFSGVNAVKSAAQTYSLLQNISCGFGTSTSCQNSDYGFSGAISCACTALCVVEYCPQPSVSASKTSVWGVYANSFPCVTRLTGTATAGQTATYLFPTRLSALYALNVITGYFVGGPRTSQEINDCFQGIMQNDVPITGVC